MLNLLKGIRRVSLVVNLAAAAAANAANVLAISAGASMVGAKTLKLRG